MANLYELNQAILACVDQDTGEIIDVEALESLMMQRTEKLESVVLWIKNLESDAVAFKAEKDAFAKREKAATNKAEQLKEYLKTVLDGQKFSTDRCAVSFRRSEQVMILDETMVPQDVMIPQLTFKPDKTAIKALLKEGKAVSGCCLVENLNPQIK